MAVGHSKVAPSSEGSRRRGGGRAIRIVAGALALVACVAVVAYTAKGHARGRVVRGGWGRTELAEVNVFDEEQKPQDEPIDMRGRGPGETGNSRDGPGSSSFTGHSTGPKGGRLTFGKGTYFNIFAPNMDGDDEASIKARAWRRLEQAKLLEHYLNDIKLKNQVFNQRLASMQKTMADEEKKLKDEQAAAANQLRTKAAQDVKMMKKTVSEVVGQVEKKLTIMQQEAWANISSRVEAEAKNQQEAADIQTAKLGGMTATQDRWLNSVNDFIAGFNKQLASDKNTYNSALAEKEKAIRGILGEIQASDAKLRAASAQKTAVVKAEIARQKSIENADLNKRLAELRVLLQTTISKGEIDMAAKIAEVRSKALTDASSVTNDLRVWQSNVADPKDAALTRKINNAQNIASGAEKNEKMSYEKYTNQLNSLKGRLTSLEAEMRAEYDRIQTEILPAMQNALKGHRAQLEAKRNTAKAILKGIRDDLHEIEWAIKQAQSRSGAYLDRYLDNLEKNFQDLTARVNRLKVQYGDQVNP